MNEVGDWPVNSKVEEWKVVRVTARGQTASIELGKPAAHPHPLWGPTFISRIETAPHVGDMVRIVYSWG